MSIDDVKIKRFNGSAFTPDDQASDEAYTQAFKSMMTNCGQATHMTIMSALLQLPATWQRADMLWSLFYGMGILADLLVDNDNPSFHGRTLRELLEGLLSGARDAQAMTPAERAEWLDNCVSSTRNMMAKMIQPPDISKRH